MKIPRFNIFEVFAFCRIILGIQLLGYFLLSIAPDFSFYFGSSGMIDPALFGYYVKSPLHVFWNSPVVLSVLFLLMVLFTFFLMIGFLARTFIVPLYFIYLMFTLSNPLILHEPDPVSMLMLFTLIFCPIEGAYTVRKSSLGRFIEEMDGEIAKKIHLIMLCYLCYYYFFAGAKKIPESSWLSGEALFHVMNWEYIARDTFFTKFLSGQSFLGKLVTWFTLIFECGFVLLAFTRWRYLLIPVGLGFHSVIGLTMDVGWVWSVVFIWYPLLLLSDPLVGWNVSRQKSKDLELKHS